MEDIVCGIDEAGRGPVIGPMILGCVVVDPPGKRKLEELKVRDSKKVSPKRREFLEDQIKEAVLEWRTVKVDPWEIDWLRVKKGISLNVIEAQKIAEMIMSLKSKPSKIIVDSADRVTEDYKTKIIEHINRLYEGFMIPEIISEHKADVNYIEVGAASIIAKVERDRKVRILREKHGELGSGYPSDEVTKKYIKEVLRKKSMPDFVRWSWSTINKSKQAKLDEF